MGAGLPGVHNLAPTDLQQKHYLNPMAKSKQKNEVGSSPTEAALLQKIASLEKQWLQLPGRQL